MEEQKQHELVINELRMENKKLKLKCLDVGNYMKWDVEQIIFWISTLDDGKYVKYLDKLKACLVEEGLSGSDLIEIEETNLKMWGIVNFRDRKDLLKQFKKLTQSLPQQQMVNNNEGALTEYH